jgi:hypothetical protein
MKKTLKDLAPEFFAAGPTPRIVEAYTFPGLIVALNDIAPFSWQDYCLVRLSAHDGAYLLDELKDSAIGWSSTQRKVPSLHNRSRRT